MTLRAGHSIQRWVPGLGLIDKELDLSGKFAHVGRMTTKAHGLILPRRGRQKHIERGAEGRGMDRTRERGRVPLFKDALMATFTFAGGRKGLFDGTLRQTYFLRKWAAVEPWTKKHRHGDCRPNSDFQDGRILHHHPVLLYQDPKQDAQKGLPSHTRYPRGYFTLPP